MGGVTTDSRAKKIAVRILKQLDTIRTASTGEVLVYAPGYGEVCICTVAELKALAKSRVKDIPDV